VGQQPEAQMVAFVVAAASPTCVVAGSQQLLAARCGPPPSPWRPHRGRRRHGLAACAPPPLAGASPDDALVPRVEADAKAAAGKPARPAVNNENSQAAQRRFQPVSWAVVEQLTDILVEHLRGQGFNTVLAVTRGGMVPATLLAQALELRNVLTATVIFYTDSGDQFFGMTEPRFLSFPSADALAGRNVLIVDDVWDSGRTASAVKKKVLLASPEAVSVAVLHYKPTQSVVRDSEPDHYAAVADDWLVYPWERVSPHHADLFGEQEIRKSSTIRRKT
jgi:uncharacterized protein